MDNQWITRVINIEASLEKSKTIAIHEYYQSLVTRGLVYKVSHAALKLITLELTNMGESHFGGKCLCIIRKTHGLPCACEIVNSHKNGNHISLNNIHDHWKQLSMDPAHEKVAAIFDWEDLFGNIRMKYEACTELQKHFMLEMLIEIADLSKKNMQEPKGKFASKGRPTLAQTEAQKKIDKSTKRDLSSLERLPTGNNSATASKKEKPTTSKRVQPISKKGKPKKKGVKSHLADEVNIIDLSDLNAPPSLNEIEENDIFPSKLISKRKKVQSTNEPKQRRKYTKKIKTNSPAMSYDEEYLQHMVRGIMFYNPKILNDVVERLENVAPDGHCGFRACAEMLGLSADDGWKTVKMEMERELTMYPDMYIPIIGGMTEYNIILRTLRYKQPIATRRYWMVLPDMGYIFASAFKCIFSSYSNMGCTTWLPLRTAPPEDFKVVTIFNLDNEHFVKAILKPGAPIPPVLNGWNSICTEEALLWTPHMEMQHRGWENIEQKQPGQRLQVIEDIDLDDPLQVIEDIDLEEP
ncbi:hypothetical protein MKX03_002406 [Papaver bracteatum]|nr:hypothetical protein MKX03_002406 [Papaver bracteatum]